MYQRPEYVNAESWDRMPEAMRQQIAETAVMIGSAPAEKRVHNPDHDGPHGTPYATGLTVVDPAIDIDKNNGPEQRANGCDASESNRDAQPGNEPTGDRGDSPNDQVSPTTSSRTLVEDGDGEPPSKRARVEKDSTVSPQKQRGEAAARGRKRRSGVAGRKENQEQEGVEEQEQEDLPPADYQDLARVKQKDLTPLNKKAKTKLSNLQVDKFRKLCGVRKDSRWPLLSDPIRIDKASGEPFWTPDFEKDVRDSVNTDLFEKIGRAVMEDLKDKKDRPAALLADGVWFNKDTIIEFAKTSFRGFKTIAIAQRDEEKLKRLKMNQQSTKLRDRRKLAHGHRLEAVPEYIALHNVDPTDVLAEDFMSDYASGPEDPELESMETWKLRMAKENGIDGVKMNADAFSKLTFWERVVPEWRSDELSNVLTELETLWWASVPATKRKRFTVIRIMTTARSSAIPPPRAPYDFGINTTWYEKHKETYANVISDWYQYGDPVGFGTKTGLVDGEAAGAGLETTADMGA